MSIRRPFAALVGLGITLLVALHAASVGPYWNISPDSATYVGTARTLVEGGGLEAGDLPAMTGVVFVPALLLFPDSYLALNALTTLLYLLSAALAFLIARWRLGTTLALLVPLLTLGYSRLIHESTQLLSEPVYMFFSIAVLAVLDRDPEREPGTGGQLLAGVALIIASQTRTVGVTLIAAVLLLEGLAFVRRDRRVRWPLVGMALLAAVCMVTWELWTVSQGHPSNVLRVFLQDPWSAEGARVTTPADMGRAVERNARVIPAIGAVLANADRWSSGASAITLQAVGTILFLVGLLRSLRRRVTLTGLYTTLCLAAVMYHIVVNRGTFRVMVPIAPLIFVYALVGAKGAFNRVGSPRLRQTLLVLGGLYLTWYLVASVRMFADRLPEQHRSPIENSLIKRPGNYDLQRLALWLRDETPVGTRFASSQTDMLDVISERIGYDVADLSAEPSRFMSWLDENDVEYVLYDPGHPIARDMVPPALESFPARFDLIEELPNAILYRVLRDGEPRVQPAGLDPTPARRTLEVLR